MDTNLFNGSDSKLMMKSAMELDAEFLKIIEFIEQDIESIAEFFDSKEIMYFVRKNDLDYCLFLHCIKKRRVDFVAQLEQVGFKYSHSTFLNEVFFNKSGQTVEMPETTLDHNDFLFMIESDSLIDFELAKLEFFYLILLGHFELATRLLNVPCLYHLRREILDIYIDTSHFTFHSLSQNKEFAVDCIKLALKRSIEGVALLISN